MTHAYAMWLGEQLPDAVSWTEKQYKRVQKKHPSHVVVIGECGWATQKANHGEQAKLIKGQPGAAEQTKFLLEFVEWADSNRVPYFYFEAFDEPWKGGDDPAEVEKHWGIYREDRTAKPARGRMAEAAFAGKKIELRVRYTLRSASIGSIWAACLAG